MKIAPSIFCMKDCSNRNRFFLENHADYIHFDIMDKSMCDCIGMDFAFFNSIEDCDFSKYEIHIISKVPNNYIDKCLELRCGTIIFSMESESDIGRLIDRVKKAGIRVGLAVSTYTSLDAVLPYLDLIDQVTIMTVQAGLPGHSFERKELGKVVELRKIRKEKELLFKIEVDGSCNAEHYEDIVKANPDIVVVGSSGLFDLSTKIESSWKKMKEYMVIDRTIYIHADLVGNPLKEIVKDWLIKNGYSVVDLYSDGVEEYPECAKRLSQCVQETVGGFGVLCCGTGQGMAMVANRIPNIRAAVVSDVYSAKMAREHNDANVLCLGARVVTKQVAEMILDVFFSSTFLFGKHTPRVERYDSVWHNEQS